jgi:hypothetical protein
MFSGTLSWNCILGLIESEKGSTHQNLVYIITVTYTIVMLDIGQVETV